jgi:hypothetical protein
MITTDAIVAKFNQSRFDNHRTLMFSAELEELNRAKAIVAKVSSKYKGAHLLDDLIIFLAGRFRLCAKDSPLACRKAQGAVT